MSPSHARADRPGLRPGAATRRPGLLVAAALAAVLLAGACGGAGDGDGDGADSAQSSTTVPAGPAAPLPTDGGCEEDDEFDPGDKHVDKPSYDVDPPAGGEHLAQPALPGVFTDAPPPDGRLVHALEHGDIVLWHRPNLTAGDLDTLTKLAREYPRHVLLVPRSSMDVPVAVTAWQKRLLCTGLDVEVLSEWIEDNRNKGPEGFVD